MTLLSVDAPAKLSAADVSTSARQLVANVEKVIVGWREPVTPAMMHHGQFNSYAARELLAILAALLIMLL